MPDQATGRTSPVVELSDIGKRYGNILALSGINLKVRQGEVTCILGDNGAGKSTLIKIIAGLHPHDAGVYKVDGEEVRFGSPREALDAGISTVYQDLALVPLMPVWRNFFLGSELTSGVWPVRRLEVAKMRRVADEELRKMGIELPDIDAAVGNLSGGQMQVVSIARAIHFGARVLILDEPTANLDVRAEAALFDGFLDATRGVTTILISHRFSTVRRADRVCVLEDGAITEQGTHDELVSLGGTYARMFRTQAEAFVEVPA
jgi:simple sugar transport system ATP-binding protein